jgi:LmbE family N-acetylglucosaminyl deacetylase
MMSKVYTPESAMAIVAHPDDIEFGCAGTLARWAQAGCRTSYVLLTSGDVGINDPTISREEAIKIREKESREAAKIAGAAEIIFIGEPDGLLQPTLELRERLVREIRRFKPEVIISGDPEFVASEGYINHPDHRAAAVLGMDAVFPASGQPTLFKNIETEFGYTAHKPRKVYFQAWGDADTYVNIEETIETKINALKAHKSQMNGWDPSEMVKNWAAESAKGKEMEYAESFRVTTLVSDEDWKVCKGDPVKLYYHKKEQREKENAEKGNTKHP